jgi:phytoene dehydrogenase-like protein
VTETWLTTRQVAGRPITARTRAHYEGILKRDLGGTGCHGGPGITFIPGYNAAYQALEDISMMT